MITTKRKATLSAFFCGALLLSAAPFARAQDSGSGAPQAPSAASISSCQTLSASTTYTLSAAITATTTPCFKVNGDNVTLNLSGFAVTKGTGGSTGLSSSGFTNLIVQNGTFKGFVIALDASGSTHTTLQNLVVEDSTSTTIPAASLGDASAVQNSIFYNNGEDGLDTGANSIVTGSIFYLNGSYGLNVTACPGDIVFDEANQNALTGTQQDGLNVPSTCHYE